MNEHTRSAEGASLAEFACGSDRVREDRLWPALAGAAGVLVAKAGFVLWPLL